jgi:hypothetical protein
MLLAPNAMHRRNKLDFHILGWIMSMKPFPVERNRPESSPM